MPSKLYQVATTTFAGDLGGGRTVTVRCGTRLRGDDPIVARWPGLFQADDGAIHPITSPPQIDEPAAPEVSGTRILERKQIPAEHALVATGWLRAPGARAFLSAWPGMRADDRDPAIRTLVKRHPNLFTKAGEAT